ncbi:hypothetical protein BGX27_000343 [Mortierella sp. AM989]|nr:hypothetical protein BGX27_000343 [Mortierella sp. AM989]
MNDALYIIKDTPSNGKGMFATRDIKHGTCILSENPLVLIGPDNQRNFEAVNSLPMINKMQFLALRNVYSEKEMPVLAGIIKTNALPRGPNSDEAAVYRDLSRVNHSCAPNVHHFWNRITEKESIHAVKDIAAGDEILTSYEEVLMPWAARQVSLQKKFRFECRCKLCTSASNEEYDATVARVKKLSDLIMVYVSMKNDPRKAIECVREILALMDKAGIWGKSTFIHDGYQISAMYSNYDLAKEWADLLLESYLLDEGESGDLYKRYLGYAQNPKSHERAGWGGYIDLKGA